MTHASDAVAFLPFAFAHVAHCAVFVHGFQPHVKAPQACHVFEHLVGLVVQRAALVGGVAQGQGAVALQENKSLT